MHSELLLTRRVIEEAAASVGGISDAHVFGSVASGRIDRFSDIDLIVQCSIAAAERFVGYLDDALTILLRYPLDQAAGPSAIYWFRSEMPFNRVDVSFHSPAEYEQILVGGHAHIRAPFLTVQSRPGNESKASRHRRPCSALEKEFAKALRQFQQSIKSMKRGVPSKYSLVQCDRRLAELSEDGVRTEWKELYRSSRAECIDLDGID